jgi:prephenate dehydratase
MNYKIGFLGPQGTFTQQAAEQLMPKNCSLIPYPSIADVLLAADVGEVDGAVVPIENSIEGSVNLTVDFLAHQVQLRIIKEVVVPVSHSLLVNHGVHLDEIKTVASHPQAIAQCRQYLREYLPDANVETVQSTAKAAENLKITGSKDSAAIGTVLAADIYDLTILAANIQDRTNNNTRFVLLAKDWEEMLKYVTTDSELWKTSILVTLAKDYPGALFEVLRSFYEEGINLTKIESRPTRKELGSYHFFIDFYGRMDNPNVQRALAHIEKTGSTLQLLGNYQILAFKPTNRINN